VDLYEAIKGKRRVLFHAFTSKYVAFAFVPSNIIYAQPHIVVARESGHSFAILQSAFHTSWVELRCSTMGASIRYVPSDVFDTFPFPPVDTKYQPHLDNIGDELHSLRAQAMLLHSIGLTEYYNQFHSTSRKGADFAALREKQREVDLAVCLAYGWQDVDLRHGFHQTKLGIRYTISDGARLEVLDRLLALNHRRHADESAAKASVPLSVSAKRARKPIGSDDQISIDL
jgi:hypothetical protein